MSSIAGYGKKYKGLDNEEEEGCLTIDETEGGVSDEASGSHAMDLSNSGGRKEMGRESQGDSPKARRYRDMRRSRTIIQAEQLNVLYGCYFKDPNPGKHEFEQISEWVHLPKKVVQIWFQNMRARERKGELGQLPAVQRSASPPSHPSQTGSADRPGALFSPSRGPACRPRDAERQVPGLQHRL
uniref:Homeobox domain-containing protein n=1 Tax=Hucho hucho TaxID=62062 RepID=A0A4W5LAS7_9TELE